MSIRGFVQWAANKKKWADRVFIRPLFVYFLIIWTFKQFFFVFIFNYYTLGRKIGIFLLFLG